jgi:spore germination cell wall hydrolase CwlJ-like protein
LDLGFIRDRGRLTALALAAVTLAALVAACATVVYGGRGEEAARGSGMARVSSDFSDAGLIKITADMDPAMLTLARRHDPRAEADLWGRPIGWASLDIGDPPTLGLPADKETAEEINSLRPFARDIPVAKPFVLKADGADRDRAVKCLSQAIYYEAAREGEKGQEAVAQTVLNRLRHPAYPKSVCGVVYQGSARFTGCQFTFTCDGALRWAPDPGLWAQAKRVAERALNGYVLKDVGTATHYHADYVAPYWAPTLVKLNKIGAHIFYRWTGPSGLPAAFTGRYAGREAILTPAVLLGSDPRTQGSGLGRGILSPEEQGIPPNRTVTLSVAGEVRTYTVADSSASGGQKTRVLGAIMPSRRAPTPDEIRQINESLATLEPPAVDAAPAAPQPKAAE